MHVKIIMKTFYESLPNECKVKPLNWETNLSLKQKLEEALVTPSHKLSKMKCIKGGSCRCRFCSLEDYIKIASCFTKYGMADVPENCDETAIANVAKNCKAMGEDLNIFGAEILDLRNKAVHEDLNLKFPKAYDDMIRINKALSSSLGLEGNEEEILSAKSLISRFIPAKSDIEKKVSSY